jgi:hypothetical protein
MFIGDRTAWSITTDGIAAAADGMRQYGYKAGSMAMSSVMYD